MDFAFLPPEVNSARMYSGPGSGALLAAAGSWDSLSAELGTTADVYESVLWGLASLQWRGPASEAMAATAAPYTGWLRATAERTTQAAMQARAAAAAFDLAYAMTVPPAAVAANRAQLAALIATNFFGQNTAAIAATETQYGEYWAQDAAAMYGYAESAAAAAQLTPFSSPDQTTNPHGVTAQHAAVNSAASNPVSQAASASANDASASSLFDFTFLDEALAFFAATDNMASLEAFPEEIIGDESNLGMLNVPPGAGRPPGYAPLYSPPAKINLTSSISSGAGLSNTTGALGRAGSIGTMSVPASWTPPSSSPVTALASSDSPVLSGSDEPAGSRSGVPGIPGMRPPSRATLVVPRYGVRITVMARPPCAG